MKDSEIIMITLWGFAGLWFVLRVLAYWIEKKLDAELEEKRSDLAVSRMNFEMKQLANIRDQIRKDTEGGL